MPTRPRLVTSIPFWALVVVSLASGIFGTRLVLVQLDTMTVGLTDNTATAVDVYAGPPVITIGAILIGAGLIGLLLALAIAALSTLRPHADIAIIDLDEEIEEIVETEAPAPVAAAPVAAAAAPVADVAAEPAVDLGGETPRS